MSEKITNFPIEYKKWREQNTEVDFKKLAEEYEPELENIKLLAIDELIVEKKKVHSDNREGYYTIECVELASNLKGALVWFPKWQAFGCIDTEHGKCFVCKDVSWQDISKNTYKYLIGKWEWDEGEEFEIDLSVEKCTFTPYVKAKPKVKAKPEVDKYDFFEKARKSIKRGKYERAIVHYKDCTKKCEIKSPAESAEISGKIGNVYLSHLNNYDSAIKSYDKAIMFNPEEANYFVNRGIAYFAKEEYDQAISDFDSGLEIDAEHYPANYRKGMTLYYGQKDVKGLEYWEKCLTLPKVDGDVFTALIEAYILNNDFDKTLKVFERWEELNPPIIAPPLGRQNNVIVGYLEAIVLKQLGKDEEADEKVWRFKNDMGNLIRDGYGWSFTEILEWVEKSESDKETKEFIEKITLDFKNYIEQK